jgi:hypothetical protein
MRWKKEKGFTLKKKKKTERAYRFPLQNKRKGKRKYYYYDMMVVFVHI